MTPNSGKKSNSFSSSTSSTSVSSTSASSSSFSPPPPPPPPMFSAPKFDFTSPAGVTDQLLSEQSPLSSKISSAAKVNTRANKDELSLGNVVDLKGHPIVPIINLPQVQSKMSEWKAKYKLSS